MEALLFSSGVVALAEIGDKTQLLALLLAARYRKPTPIIVGILIATLFNHAAAAGVGQWVTSHLGAETMRWLLGASFLGMAIWIMIPDKLDSDTRLFERLGIFGATFIAFFLAEMGDKTQIATVALAARFDSLISVVAGTTIGMLLANVPAVLFGDMVASRIPTRTVHTAAATLFAGLGVVTLLMPLSP
ncbi:MAG: TMEM165/GDT1 family protein [Pseudogulbenkiania sp.]|nr:TMEM165/GDT1 family protein [Pseudogulbenkiania sp.]